MRLIFLITTLLSLLGVQAQEITIKTMATAPMDFSASQYLRKDIDGNPCALVKVQLAAEGAKFEGNIVQPVEYKTGEYWVYMTEGAYMLKVKHPNFLPLRVNFRDYDISSVEKKATYKLILLIPQSVPVVENKDEPFTVKGVSFNMIHVEGGTFQMGATSEQGSDVGSDEKPVHQVTLSSFFIGETEVTQELWEAVMGSNPSWYKGKKCPVENVSWDNIQEFIRKLNAMTGKQFRLPTEAEWEYAARGGKKSMGYKYSGSNTIDDVAWYTENTNHKRTCDVKTKQANELGLYDMSGNVYEWCNDCYGDYSSSSQSNPKGPSSTSNHKRVLRGGAFSQSAKDCRVSGRASFGQRYTGPIFGLRLAL